MLTPNAMTYLCEVYELNTNDFPFANEYVHRRSKIIRATVAYSSSNPHFMAIKIKNQSTVSSVAFGEWKGVISYSASSFS